MTKRKYLVYSIDALKSPVFEPKIIYCLRAFARNVDIVELYEYSNRTFTFICSVSVKIIQDQKVIEIKSKDVGKYAKLRAAFLKNRVKGMYRNDPTKPFAFVLKEVDRIKI